MLWRGRHGYKWLNILGFQGSPSWKTCSSESTCGLIFSSMKPYPRRVQVLLLQVLVPGSVFSLFRDLCLTVALVVKNPPANAEDVRDTGSTPSLGRSPGRGHGNPLQYSCLENSMDRGAWWAKVHRVAENRLWLKWLNRYTHIPHPTPALGEPSPTTETRVSLTRSRVTI